MMRNFLYGLGWALVAACCTLNRAFAEEADADRAPLPATLDVVWRWLPPRVKSDHDQLEAEWNQAIDEGRVDDEQELAYRICVQLVRYRSPLYMHQNVWNRRYEEAVRIGRLSTNDRAVVHKARVAAKACLALGRATNYAEALVVGRPAVAVLKEKLGEENEAYLMAQLIVCAGDPKTDDATWQACTSAMRRYYGDWHPLYAEALSVYCRAMLAPEKFEQALPLLAEAHDVFTKTQSTTPFGLNCLTRSNAYFHLGRYQEAEPMAMQGISILHTSNNSNYLKYLYFAHQQLGAIYAKQGDTTSAIQAFETAESLPAGWRGVVTPQTQSLFLEIYIQALRAERRDAEAAVKEEELKQLKATLAGAQK